MRSKAIGLIVSIAINVVGGIIAFFVIEDPWMAGLVVLAGGLCTVIVLLFLRVEGISRTLTDVSEGISRTLTELSERTSLKPPECCALHVAGFSQVFERADQSLNLTIESVSDSYKFLGATAQCVLTKSFKELVVQKVAEKGCRFQVLLLDPDAREVVTQHATEEGELDPEALIYRLRQSIAELKSLAGQCDGKLEVWLYHDLPMFRLVLIDDERMYVSFYRAKGLMGVHTPQLVFVKTDRSFFIPFWNFYERTLRSARRLV